MDNRDRVLISAAELAELCAAGAPLSVLDVRWRLDEPDGSSAYLQGHIPGAVYVSLDDDLSDHDRPALGRHPLPRGAALQRSARRWGVRENSTVVVYDDWIRAGSARAWWVLTAAGVADVRILDGGLDAWRSISGPLETGPIHPTAGDVVIRHDDLYAGALPTLTAGEIAHRSIGLVLLDARAPQRFEGASEPVDPVAGHIPGALNLPSGMVLAEDGTFGDDGALSRLLADKGISEGDDVGVYCGSGVTAAITVAALAATGRRAALFPGSWSQWSADPTCPVARGPE